MSDTDKAQENSHSATNEPWKKPGQTAQDPANQHPDPDVVEKEKGKKGIN